MKDLRKFLIVLPLLLLLGGCGSKENVAELIENGKLAYEQRDYEHAADYYERALNAEPDNLEARFGLEDVFHKALNEKDAVISQQIYAYT